MKVNRETVYQQTKAEVERLNGFTDKLKSIRNTLLSRRTGIIAPTATSSLVHVQNLVKSVDPVQSITPVRSITPVTTSIPSQTAIIQEKIAEKKQAVMAQAQAYITSPQASAGWGDCLDCSSTNLSAQSSAQASNVYSTPAAQIKPMENQSEAAASAPAISPQAPALNIQKPQTQTAGGGTGILIFGALALGGWLLLGRKDSDKESSNLNGPAKQTRKKTHKASI